MNKKTLLFRMVAVVILATHLSNIWRLHTYPFTDLPNHLAEAYLLRTLTLNPSDPLGNYYQIAITPYTPTTLYAVFCALFPNVEFGNKVFYTLCILLMVGGMFLLIRAAKGDLWLALLAALFFYHLSTMWGLVGITVGVGLSLLAMVALVRYLEHPSPWFALWLALIALGVYYAHPVTWIFVVISVGVALLFYLKTDIKYRLLGISTLLPGIALFIFWKIGAEYNQNYRPTLPFLVSYYRSEYLASIRNRLIELFLLDNNFLGIGHLSKIFALILTGPLVVGLLIMIFRQRANILNLINSPSRFCGVIFLSISGICYLTLPNRLPAQHILFERFSVLVFLGVIWVGSFLVSGRLRMPVRGIVTLLLLLHTGLWFQYFQRFEQTAQPFRLLLYHNPDAQNRSLTAIIISRDFRGHPAFSHYQNYQIIWNHGPAVTGFVRARFRIIQERAEGILPYYFEEVARSKKFNQAMVEYQDINLILTDSQDILKRINNFGVYQLIGQVDPWYLLENIASPR